MKTKTNKTVLGILAMIASVGTVHAETLRVEVVSTEQKQAIVNELVGQGYLLPTANPEWYQINQERLNDALTNGDAGNAQDVINKLKALAGKGVDIRSVNILSAHMGSQDV